MQAHGPDRILRVQHRYADLQAMEQLGVAELWTDPVLYVAHPLSPLSTDVDYQLATFGHLISDPCKVDGAHRLAIDANLARAKRWLTWLRRTFPAITFIAPWITAIESDADDSDEAQRSAGLRDDCRVVNRCDGIVLCGGRVSSGMATESARARVVFDLTHLGAEPPR